MFIESQTKWINNQFQLRSSRSLADWSQWSHTLFWWWNALLKTLSEWQLCPGLSVQRCSVTNVQNPWREVTSHRNAKVFQPCTRSEALNTVIGLHIFDLQRCLWSERKTMGYNLGIHTHYKESLEHAEIVGLCGQTAANRYFTQPNM